MKRILCSNSLTCTVSAFAAASCSAHSENSSVSSLESANSIDALSNYLEDKLKIAKFSLLFYFDSKKIPVDAQSTRLLPLTVCGFIKYEDGCKCNLKDFVYIHPYFLFEDEIFEVHCKLGCS